MDSWKCHMPRTWREFERNFTTSLVGEPPSQARLVESRPVGLFDFRVNRVS